MDIIELYKKDDLFGTYLLMGKEKYLMEDVLEHSKKKWIDEGTRTFNLNFIDGSKSQIKDILERSETLPFMADKKLLVVKEIGSLIEQKKPEDDFYEALLNVPDSTILFLLENEVSIKKNTKLYKRLKKADRVVEFSKLNHGQLISFIQKYVRGLGAEMERAEIEFFIQRSNYESRNIEVSLYEIKNELDKLVSYSQGKISKEKIEASMELVSTDNIFDLLTSLVKNDIKKALEIKGDLLRKEEPVQRILYMIIRQTRLLLGYKLLESTGYGRDEIQSRLGIKPFEAKKIQGQSQGFSIERLKDYYEFLNEMDQDLKRSNMEEEMALDLLFLKMGNKKTENFR